MNKTFKRILAAILVLVLSMSFLTATAAAASAADQSASAQSLGIGSFFKKVASAIKSIFTKIFGGNKPEPQPQPEETTTVPAVPEADNKFEFKENVGSAEYAGGFH